MTTARELLQEAVDLLEFWINREDRRGMSECQWKTWHALGHGSNTMKKLRAYLAQAEPEDHPMIYCEVVAPCWRAGAAPFGR